MKISNAFAVMAASIGIATRTASAFSPPASPPSSHARLVPASSSSSSYDAVVGTALRSTVDDKTEVREYFNNEGFSRWNKIYSDSDEVNNVQLDIRKGHDMTIQKILNWVKDDGNIAGKTVCDCGCGVGSLAIPLAQMGEFFFSFFPSGQRGMGESFWLYSLLILLCSRCPPTLSPFFPPIGREMNNEQGQKSRRATSPMPWRGRPRHAPSQWGSRMPNSTRPTSNR
jgi:hypothetical protein